MIQTIRLVDKENTKDQSRKMSAEREELFKYSGFFHRSVGLWPENDQPLGRFWRIKCRVVAAVTIGAFVINISTPMGNLDKNDWPEFIVDALTALVAIAKVIPLLLNRNNLLKISQVTLQINLFEKKSLKEKEIARHWFKSQTRLTIFLIVSYTTIVLIYCLIPLFSKTTDKFPLKGHLPAFAYLTPWYEIVYVFEVIIFIIRCMGVLSCDLYCAIFVYQLCSELQIIQYLVTTIDRSNKNILLLYVIQRHQIALNYGRLVCENLSIIFLLQYLLISMILCFSGIIALHTDNIAVCVKMTCFVVLALIELFLICLIGETIKEESLKIAKNAADIYVKSLGDRQSTKLISFMVYRALKPLQLRLGKNSTLNFRFYSVSINRIFSFFTVFKTLVN